MTDETEVVEGEETEGNQNDARLAVLNGIADAGDTQREGELTPVGDEVPEEQEAEVPPEEVPEPAKEPEQKKYTLKVNGKQIEVSETELIARAQKVEAADDYLSRAAEVFHAQKPSKDAPVTVEEDYRSLARTLQMGTEEEAAGVLKKLSVKAAPSFNQDDLAQMVDARHSFREAASWLQTEYSDIMSDPKLAELVVNEDRRLIESGDGRSYKERYKAIGDGLRQWKATFVPAAVDKQQRKATVSAIPTASMRAAPKQEEETDDDPRSVIANIAKQRGQTY